MPRCFGWRRQGWVGSVWRCDIFLNGDLGMQPGHPPLCGGSLGENAWRSGKQTASERFDQALQLCAAEGAEFVQPATFRTSERQRTAFATCELKDGQIVLIAE